MLFKKKPLARAMAAFGASGLALAAIAQQPPAPPTQKVEKIEVTGSNIKRVDAETASPVQIITADDITKSGATSIGELLRSVPSANAGSLSDFNAGTGFSPGSSTVSLRGLGSAATLVLVNGRRLAPAAFADPNAGASVLFNLNAIPISAIDRIELLKDGASAIYGSEAVAGVINIILRKDYTGAALTLGASQNEGGQFKSNSLSAIVGFGDLAKDRFNGFINFDHFHRDRVKIKDVDNVQNDTYNALYGRIGTLSSRAYPPNFIRERTPGSGVFNVLVGPDPRCPTTQIAGGLCRFDQYDVLSATAKSDRDGVFARGTFEFSPTLTAFGELAFSRVKTDFLGNPPLADELPITWFSQNGTRFRFDGFILPVGHPDNPNPYRVLLRYRFLDLGYSVQTNTQDTTRALVGLNGTWRNWDWESGLLYNKTERRDHYNGFLHYPTLSAALQNGTYRPFASNDPALLSRLNPFIDDQGSAATTIWDLKGSTEVMSLANGPMMAATGVEFRREELTVSPDDRIVRGEFVGLGASQASGSRNVSSWYGELSIPLLKSLESQVAARYDKYSDYGNSTTPKVGLKWKPLDSLALRATYAEGFRAPAISQISPSNVQVFNTITDPVRCGKPGADAEDCTGRAISSLIRANPGIQPEKSKSYTVGFVFSPSDQFALATDLYDIRRRDEVNRLTSQFIINRESSFPGQIIRDTNPAAQIPGVPNSGPILSTIRQFFNLGGTRTRGIDIDASGKISLGQYGRLRAALQTTYLITYKSATRAGDPMIEYASGFGPVGELPKVRGTVSLNWDYNKEWSFLARENYVSGWFYGTPGGTCGDPTFNAVDVSCKIKPWQTTDLGVTYSGVKNLSLNLIVRNIDDKAAPFDPNNTTLGFNPGYHNPYGRYFTASASYRFK